jgi:multiple sugar transport system substrate-binding protein
MTSATHSPDPQHESSRPEATGVTRRRFLTGSLGVAAGFGLAACGQGSGSVPGGQTGAPAPSLSGSAAASAGGAAGYSGPKVDLQFWNGFTGGDGPFMQRLVDQFNTEHANISVKMNTMQWADYYKKLPTAVTTGKGPEIGIMHVDSVATNAARNVIQPLDEVASALQLSADDFAPVPWKAGIYKDRRYSIPLDVHPLGFFYNKAVMESAGLDPEKPPTDAESYGKALEALKSKGIAGHWVTPFPFTASMTVQSVIWQFGGDMIAPDASQVMWADEAGVKGLTWYADMIKKGYSPGKQAQDADFVALQNGKCAFNWNGIWAVNTMRDVEKAKGVKWGVAALPNIGGKPAAWAGSHQFILPVLKTPDENKSLAARVFLNWVSQKSIEWAKGGQVPARNSVRESPEFAALTEQAALAKQIDHLHFPPAVAGIGDAYVEFEKALNEVVSGGKDPKTSLSDAAGRATKILEANKKKYG